MPSNSLRNIYDIIADMMFMTFFRLKTKTRENNHRLAYRKEILKGNTVRYFLKPINYNNSNVYIFLKSHYYTFL